MSSLYERLGGTEGITAIASDPQANFDFYNARLRGQKEQEPRWKRCVSKAGFSTC